MIHPESEITHEAFAPVLEELKNGNYAVLINDCLEKKERGYLFQPAKFSSIDKINKISRISGGITYLALDKGIYNKLKLPLKEGGSEDNRGNVTLGINVKKSDLDEISSEDKFLTVNQVIKDDMKGDEFVPNGQIFPISAKSGGILSKVGFPEAAVDIAKMCGEVGASIICELFNDHGLPATKEELLKFSEENHFKVISLSDLYSYHIGRYSTSKIISQGDIDTNFGKFPAKILQNSEKESAIVIQSQEPLNNSKPVNIIYYESDPLQDIKSLTSDGVKENLDSEDFKYFSVLENSLYILLQSSYDQNSLNRNNMDSSLSDENSVVSANTLFRIGSICSNLNINSVNIFSKKQILENSNCGFGVAINETKLLKNVDLIELDSSRADKNISNRDLSDIPLASNKGSSFVDKSTRRDDSPRIPKNPTQKMDIKSYGWKSIISKVLHDEKEAIDVHRLKITFLDSNDDATIKADLNILKEILIHLLDNVIRYTPKKAGSLGIEIKEHGKFGVLGFYDNGIGISSQELNELKDKIKVVSNNEINNSGQLIQGLKISNQFITKMNGKLEIKSELGVGSQFFISMPLDS